MSSILESMMAKPRVFRPENGEEYTMLQLAKKLGDSENILKYVALLNRHSLTLMVEAFHIAIARDNKRPQIAFVEALRLLSERDRSNE